MATKKRFSTLELALQKLKAPKEWPAIGRLFSRNNQLKTSEHLLFCGPVGAYCFQFLDVDDAIREDMIKLLKLMGVAMRKSSTPGDRALLRTELAPTVTRLEICLPVFYQTMVMHYLVFHTLEQLETTGPFHVANQLDMERFQVVLKGCARGKKNVMTSILNNFLLLEVSLSNRLTSTFDWTVTPTGSSTASYLAQRESKDKTDRMYTPKGKFKRSTIETESFNELKALWRLRSATYKALCSRFDQEQRNMRNMVRARSIADWHPVRNKLSEREEQWTQMQPQVLVTHANVINRVFQVLI